MAKLFNTQGLESALAAFDGKGVIGPMAPDCFADFDAARGVPVDRTPAAAFIFGENAL